MTNRTQSAELFAPTPVQNAYGATETTFKSIAQCYVALEYLSVKEEKRGAQTRAMTRYKVAMRHRKDIQIGWQLQVNNEQLRITSMDHVSSEKHLFLEVETV